jgi:hypothetical protein
MQAGVPFERIVHVDPKEQRIAAQPGPEESCAEANATVTARAAEKTACAHILCVIVECRERYVARGPYGFLSQPLCVWSVVAN